MSLGLEGIPPAPCCVLSSSTTFSLWDLMQVEARPTSEVRAPTPAEVASMKAHEYAIQADEQQRAATAKGQEALALRHQTELLEVQSQGLLAQASQEKLRRDARLADKAVAEQEEWREFVHAERAEEERRAVVMAARPAAAVAEESELEALRVRQLAADTHFHAEVLERRAAALTTESTELRQLSMERRLEAERIAAALLVKRQEQAEWQQRVDEVSSGDLPSYIKVCQAEIGRLTHRINELREEIDWARLEMERLHGEGETWRRVLQTKQSEAALLLLRMEQAKAEAEEAELRAAQAAQDSFEPNRLALEKYEEAKGLAERAADLEAEAQQAQERVLEVVRQAVGPERARQEHLRYAAGAELRAKRMEAEAQLLAGRMERRLAEAETRGETAAVLASQAARVQEEARAAGMVAEVQREMAGAEVEAEARHAQRASAQAARERMAPPSPEMAEAARRQREQFSQPTPVETVPVDMPAVPVAPPASPTSAEVAALLAGAPVPPTTRIPVGPPAALEEGAQEPVAA